MAIVHIFESELSQGIHKAMQALNRGAIVNGMNQDRPDQLKEIALVMEIASVEELKMTMAMPGGVEDLGEYVMELVHGSNDEHIDLYGYTYHDLFSSNVSHVIETLKADPTTRQATLHVANKEAARLEYPPCLQLIHYTIKDGKLNTYVVFRSNDGVKAVAMNAFALVALSRCIANELGIPLGSYIHYSISFHAYSRDWKTLAAYCQSFDKRDCTIDYDEFTEHYEELITGKYKELYIASMKMYRGEQ